MVCCRGCLLHTQPVVNEDTSGDVTALRADNQRLQRELAHLRTMVQVCVGMCPYP
jgi:hypothetical protein